MDSWRRATASPFHPGGVAPSLNVVMPSYVRSSSPGFVHRDGTSYVTLSPDRPPLASMDALRRDEQARIEYEEARRSYTTVLQRERQELDTAKHEADALRFENGSMKRDLLDAQSQSAAARRDRDLANATLAADTATLRAENHRLNNEAQILRNDISSLHTAHTTTLAERAQLEMMVSTLRAELVAVGRQVVEQNSTIRSMTSHMSRSDPYHLVKERREQTDPSIQGLKDEIADAKAKLAAAADERARVKADVKTLEDELALLRKKHEDASSQLNAVRGDQTARIAASNTERDVAIKHAQESAQQVDRLMQELKAAKIVADAEVKKREDLQKALDSQKAIKPPAEPLKGVVPEAERKRYEDEIAALHKQCQDSKAKADRQLASLDDLKQQLKAAHSTLTRVERGGATPALTAAPLVNVDVGIVCCSGLLERDPGHAGLQDPFVVLVDTLDETALKTAPINDTCNPKFNPDVDCTTLRLTKGSTAPIRLEVWMLGLNNQNKFLGCASLSSKSLLEGGVGNRTIELGPREKENDEDIVKNRSKLGSITVRIKCAPAGTTPAPPPPSVPAVAAVVAPPPVVVAPTAPTAPVAPPVVQPTAPVLPPPLVAPQPPTPAPPPARTQPKATGPQDVIFYVTSCEGLLDRDTFGGKSDPYVKIVRKGAVEFKTSSMSGTSEPKWPPSENSSKTLVVDPEDANPFVMEVWDDDSPASDEFLGQASLTAADILSGSGPRRLQLKPRPDEKDKDILTFKDKLGFVTVQLTILADAARRGESSVEKKPTGGGPAPPPPPPPTAPPSAEKIEAASTGPAQRILVQVVSCAGLSTRMMSNTDPYVIVHDTTGAEALVTPTIPDNANPTWAAETASKELIIAPSSVSFLTFDVLDNQKLFGGVGLASKYLGFAKISANEVLAIGDGKRTLTLVPRDNETDDDVKKAKSLGTITLQFSRIYSAPPNAAAGVAAPVSAATAGGAPAKPAPVVEELREAIITVCAAKDVLARNTFPFKGSDVFVRVLGVDGTKKHQTLTRSNTCTATWDDVEGTVKLLLSPSQTADAIAFEVWDAFTGGSDNFLGLVKVTVPEIFAMHGETKTFPLVPRPNEADKTVKEAAEKGKLGSLVVKVSVSGQSGKKMSSMIVQTMGAPVAAPTMDRPFGVKVWVKGCSNLMNRQPNGEISDPFVKIRSPSGEEHRTKTVDNNLNPTWDAIEGSMRFSLNPVDKLGMITFTVSDVGYQTGLRPMGFAQVAVRDLVTDGFGTKVLKLGLEEKENDPDLIRQKDQLGTVTVEIVPDNATAAPAAVAAVRPAADVSQAAPVAFTIQVLSASKLVKRQRPPCAVVEARDGANNVLFKSAVASENLNPVWISLPSSGNAVGQAVLSGADSSDLSFWLYDERPEGRTPLGVAKIPVRTVCAGGQGGQWELAVTVSEKENDAFLIANKAALGTLMVSAKPPATAPVPQAPAAVAAPTPQAPPPPPPPQKKKLRVVVKQGKNLTVKDFRSSDPLIRIFRNNEQLFQSKTQSSTVNPTWDDAKVEMEVNNQADTLLFRVLDEDGVMSHTYEDMGEVSVPISDAMAKPGERELPLTLNSKPAGTIVVVFEVL